MARRKGGKFWDGLSRREWLALFGDPEIMTDLMMDIFRVLYRRGGEDRAKNLAAALSMDYRGLNSAVGQAGIKIRTWYEARHGVPDTMESGSEEAGVENGSDEGHSIPVQMALGPIEGVLDFGGESQSAGTSTKDEGKVAAASDGESARSEAVERAERTNLSVMPHAPWEYVFDGTEEPDGTYLWILKPGARAAWQELVTAGDPSAAAVRKILFENGSAAGMEGSLFAAAPEHTLDEVRGVMRRRGEFLDRSRRMHVCCPVCGLTRISLLTPEPYGKKGDQQKGLYFCPTHGALFRAHLISFSENSTLLVSKSLTEGEQTLLGIEKGMFAKAPFSKRRMVEHRREFRALERLSADTSGEKN